MLGQHERSFPEVNLQGMSLLLKSTYQEYGLEFPGIPEYPKRHYPVTVFMGPPGSGKTEAARILQDRFGGQLFLERPEENPYLHDSYNRNDPEVILKSQATFLLLKFQSYCEAMKTSIKAPVYIEPSIQTDLAYVQTFLETGKISDTQAGEYRKIWNILAPFVYPGDVGVGIIPPQEILNKRIAVRGRDYEQAWTSDFKEGMSRNCWQLQKDWMERQALVHASCLDYVNDPGDRTIFINRFHHRVTGLFGNGESGILWPDHWEKLVSPGNQRRESVVYLKRN